MKQKLAEGGIMGRRTIRVCNGSYFTLKCNSSYIEDENECISLFVD